MTNAPDTVAIAFVRGMVSGPRLTPADRDRALREVGIAPALLDEPSARVTLDRYVALFARLMDDLDDEFLGFLSRPMKRGTLALLMRAMLGATTLAHALRRFAGALRVLQDDLELVSVRDGDLAGVQLVYRDARVAEALFLHELQLRVFFRVLAWVHGDRLKPARFDFAFPAPAHAAEYERVFPGTVRFDAPRSTVWFDAEHLDAPMLRDEPALKTFLDQAPRIVIVPRRADHTTIARVRAHLQGARPAWPDLAATAGALHWSASTLQRRLSNEGTTFQALKDGLRRDLAIQRLSTSTTSLAHLADELGFADAPAFQRAFKAWTGSPPGMYRKAAS